MDVLVLYYTLIGNVTLIALAKLHLLHLLDFSHSTLKLFNSQRFRE